MKIIVKFNCSIWHRLPNNSIRTEQLEVFLFFSESSRSYISERLFNLYCKFGIIVSLRLEITYILYFNKFFRKY